ncbi:class II aldolase/adducin family protein [Pseudonocardia sp. N23]|uniref:class II aldolase/adducin family protein n=1 Tax=Pseudonocardia sp. N23 TaxID=1987376 RepID=UPI000BFB8350|nr:class II aldolase/adducin family protein [Pseudonocardia sp. N23]GAY11566.1 ribulose-5-phosphate 4-epimerase and related epimerases and aldolases [Pseudonocardia sp. N23]
MLLREAREAVVEHCLRMRDDDLTVATSGNISVRVGDLVAVTPSGVAYESLTAAGVCVVDMDGHPADAATAGVVASSELPMHLAVYRGTDAGAVVHTHPLYATTVSLLLDELPAVHYMVAALGGPVRVAPYATYGTSELAEASVVAMAGRTAVILRNHGATTYGPDLPTAYTRSLYLEWLCRLWHQASLAGTPRLLPPEEIDRVAALLRGYGQRPGEVTPG